MMDSWKFTAIILAVMTMSALNGSAAKDDQSAYLSSQNLTLQILGNANEDDIINEQDIAYVEGIINKTNSKTNLSDANCDGSIDDKDVDCIKQIINGTEEKLMLIDGSDSVVSFDLPIEKLAVAHMPEYIVALGEFQKVVGVPSYMLTDDVLTEIYPDIKNLPDFGKTGSFDREALAAIKPDVMIVWDQYPAEIEDIKKLGITVFEINTTKNNKNIDSFREEVLQFGYMFNKVDRAKEIISSINKIEDLVRSRVSAIPEEKRVKGISMNSVEPAKVRTLGEKWQIAGITDLAEGKIAKSGSEVEIETIVDWDSGYNQYLVLERLPRSDLWKRQVAGSQSGQREEGLQGLLHHFMVP